MFLQIYLVASFLVLVVLLAVVLRSLNLRALRRLPRAERFKIMRSKIHWWWSLIFIIPLANAIITSVAYSPVPTTPPSNYQTSCSSNADCSSGSTCMVTGPLIAGQPVHKVCVKSGEVVPL